VPFPEPGAPNIIAFNSASRLFNVDFKKEAVIKIYAPAS
jgi:hypothetical protein